jgi:hypothetical protein
MSELRDGEYLDHGTITVTYHWRHDRSVEDETSQLLHLHFTQTNTRFFVRHATVQEPIRGIGKFLDEAILDYLKHKLSPFDR